MLCTEPAFDGNGAGIDKPKPPRPGICTDEGVELGGREEAKLVEID